MELAVILVLLVLIELAITFFLLGRLRDYRHTLNGLVDELANVEHGLDRALESLYLTETSMSSVENDLKNGAKADILAAAKIAENGTPDEVAQAKRILESLGVKLDS